MTAPLRGRPVLASMARYAAWLVGEQGLRMVVGALVGVVVARHLGPDRFGTLSVAFAYLVLVSAASQLGLQSVVVRDLVRHPARRGVILGSALALRLVAAVVAGLVGLLVVRVVEGEATELLCMVAIAFAALLPQCAEVIDFLLQSELRGGPSSVARGTGFMLASIARLLMVLAGAPLLLFASTPFIEAVVVAGLLAGALRRRPAEDSGRWSADRRLASALLRSSLPVAISGFAVIAVMQLDRLMLERISGPDAAGVYAAAAMLSGVWYAVPVIIGATVAPTLTDLFDRDREIYRRRLTHVYGAVTGVAIAVGTVCTLFSSPLIALFFGAKFADAAPVLAVHGWTGLFVAHVSIRTRAMMIEGVEPTILRFSLLTLGSVVVLNAVLIPRFGAIGAAWASLASWALNATVWPMARRTTRVHAAALLRSLVPSAWVGVLRDRAA